MRGEVGLRSNPGEGEPSASRFSEFAEAPLTPTSPRIRLRPKAGFGGQERGEGVDLRRSDSPRKSSASRDRQGQAAPVLPFFGECCFPGIYFVANISSLRPSRTPRTPTWKPAG